MGLFTHVSNWLLRGGRLFRHSRLNRLRAGGEPSRRMLFEAMEPRQLMAADPLRVGAVYVEQDSGSDLHGDAFEITFQGGAAGTELTRLEIRTDQSTPGLGIGDNFFDTAETGLGGDHAAAFEIVSLTAANPNASVSAEVTDGGLLLVLTFTNFTAGDKLVISIDVDEVEQFDPAETDLATINEGFDPIASGVEFQGSQLVASFTAPHYHDLTASGEFRNRYDAALSGTGLVLSEDNFNGQRDRSAGAVGHAQQLPLPIEIAGTVFLDSNLDLVQQSGDAGIAGVTLSLWQKTASGGFEFTGHTTTTDSQGRYEFGANLDLPPGTYQVRETQPAGLFSVGAIPGTVSGQAVGATLAGDPNTLTEIAIPLGGLQAVRYDFAEAEPAAISGYVYHDANNDGLRAGETGISGARLRIVPIQTIATQAAVELLTNASGFYQATGLSPGTYRVIEVAQPAGYLDGLDAAGTVNGQVRGGATNPGEAIDAVPLFGGDAGVEFNFGELIAASIAGRVQLSGPDGDCFSSDGNEDDHAPLDGVVVRLLDATGTQIAETLTDDDGRYRFDGLLPGVYRVVEVTPAGFLDGSERAGGVNGSPRGNVAGDDTLGNIRLQSGDAATGYDFCEHLPAGIAGFVYHDRDNDGRRESGEPGIGGVTLRLLDATGATIATQTTDANGFYRFADLPAGTYTVVEEHPPMWIDGLDSAGSIGGTTVGAADNPGDRLHRVTLRFGDHGIEYNFGELKYGAISGSVNLTDADGDCDGANSSLRPISGAVVRLLNANGAMIAETTTGGDGQYRFDELLPGTYSVVAVTPDGLIDGGEHPGTIGGVSVGSITGPDTLGGITLQSGQEAVEYDFCEHEPASIKGVVYHDADNDGVYDPGETPIAGVVVLLRNAAGAVIATATTDADGCYRFMGLAAGRYSIVEMHPAAYLDGLDTPGNLGGSANNPGDAIGDVDLRWGDVGRDYNFGELLRGSISGRVHADLDGDCLFDANETPLAGVTIELLDAAGTVIATTQTDANGQYRFEQLAPGTYRVREIQPAGYFHGGQRPGSGGGDVSLDDIIAAIALGSGRDLVNYDFCEQPPASIRGYVHADTDGDCVRDEGEQRLSGVTIELLDESGAVVATTQTAADGSYRFDGLRAGRYSVRELQPAGYYHGGQRAGSGGGRANTADLISGIDLRPGADLTEYDFCEQPPASIGGFVHADTDGDCVRDEGELRLSGVTIELLDESGTVIATTLTAADGSYRFDDLRAGVYSIREQQPAGYFHGGQRAGSGGGSAGVADLLANISITAGANLTDYDFCEIPPASLGGVVHLDPNLDCRFDETETPLAGVTIRLRDSGGQVVGVTQTDANGRYRFDNLPPGEYSVEQEQPAAYLHEGQVAGDQGGDAALANAISAIAVSAGQQLLGYDFCEVPPGLIAGFVYQDGPVLFTLDGLPPKHLRTVRDGQRTGDDVPLAGVVMELRDGISGDPITADRVLPGVYPAGPIRVTTDESGYYEFRGLPRGNYAVYQIHPEAYADGIDTPGTTSGIAINPEDDISPLVLQRYATAPRNDAIVLIPLPVGGESRDNNFSEVLVRRQAIPPSPPPEFVPPPPAAPLLAALPPVAPRPIFVAPPAPRFFVGSVGGGGVDFTWHLSVIDGGLPRGNNPTIPTEALVWRAAGTMSASDWAELASDEGRWLLGFASTAAEGEGAGSSDAVPQVRRFGIRGGLPLVGDFDGDGRSELGIYHKGHWYLDLNGNGVWDEADLWAKLGDEFDTPVVGDWNGDGKDDIGIYGPAWDGDPRAIHHEPGLPDLHNQPTPQMKPKNMPPNEQEATDGRRLMQVTAEGKLRVDVIDHVFHFGASVDKPLAGDWTGDGIRTVGVFKDGNWRIDLDGDGRLTSADAVIEFGQKGDLPFVGDFDGNGIDEIGVFRAGQWIIDLNGNRQIDAHDRVFTLGGAGDAPVVGDWNGDGADDPGVYQEVE